MPAPRPLPVLDDPETRPFWEACRRHELSLQRCAACGRLRFYPAPLCPHCHAAEAAWVAVSGRGTIWSFVVVHPPVLPAFRDRAPFAVVLVELDDDPRIRLLGNLVDRPLDAIAVGMRVEVAWEDLDDVTLPQWRPLR